MKNSVSLENLADFFYSEFPIISGKFGLVMYFIQKDINNY